MKTMQFLVGMCLMAFEIIGIVAVLYGPQILEVFFSIKTSYILLGLCLLAYNITALGLIFGGLR